MSTLAAAIERRPALAFAAFALFHLAVWTALPGTLYPNLPLDLIEALIYGREWQLGYDKLPPLPWWLVELTRRLFGPDFFFYALAQVAVIAAFAAVWGLARMLVGGVAALVALLIIDGLHYFHFTAAKFNHDVIQLPFWALAGYAYWAALRHGRMRHWLLLGISVGLAFWAKYFVLVLALPLALFLLADRDARRHLGTPGPYVAAAAALVVAAPHLVWLVQNDFLPFRYADVRAAPPRHLLHHITRPLHFAAGQLYFIAPALLIAAPLIWPRSPPGKPAPQAFDRRIVTLLAFGPAATLLALALLSGRATVAMWGYPLWLFVGLWIVMLPIAVIDRVRLARVLAVWAAVFAVFPAVFVMVYGILPNITKRYPIVLYPGDRTGAEMSARFRALTGRPLAYVIGSMWSGGNVAHYAPERPRVLIDGSPARAPWIDLGDLAARGAIVIWGDSDRRRLPPQYRAVAEDAEVQEPLRLPYHWTPDTIVIGWAVLRPRPVHAERQMPPLASSAP